MRGISASFSPFVVLIASLAVLSSASAQADALGDIVQPGISLHWQFGGRGSDLELGLRLDYPERLQARLSDGAVLPALAMWSVSGNGRHALYANGLQLGASRLWAAQAESGDPAPPSEQHGFWGGNVGLILLASGAAVALVIAAAGDAADDITEDYSPGGGSGSGGGSGNGDCDVPGVPPITGDCVASGI